MYRQHLQEKQADGDWIVDRVYELPVVTSAFGQLSAIYSGVKLHNRLFRFTLETAEGGLNVAVETARPVVAKFDKQIGVLNTVACQQLDKLEEVYPIITKPTDEVLKETKQQLNTAIQPIVTRVSAVKQYSMDKVTGAKTSAGEKINGVKDYGWITLNAASDLGTKQMTRALETTVFRESLNRLGAALDIADHYVDSYLPDTDVNSSESSKSVVCDGDDERQTGQVFICKASNLSNKVRRRMYGRIASQLRNAKLRTSETIEHMNFTVNLMEYSRGTVNGAVDKVSYIWTEINKSEEEVAKELIADDADTRLQSNSTFESRAIATARHLTQKVKQTASTVGLDKVPATIHSQLEPMYSRLSNSMSTPVSNASAFGRRATSVLWQYEGLAMAKFSVWLNWIVATSPVKVPFVSRWTCNESTTCGAGYEVEMNRMQLGDMVVGGVSSKKTDDKIEKVPDVNSGTSSGTDDHSNDE